MGPVLVSESGFFGQDGTWVQASGSRGGPRPCRSKFLTSISRPEGGFGVEAAARVGKASHRTDWSADPVFLLTMHLNRCCLLPLRSKASNRKYLAQTIFCLEVQSPHLCWYLDP